jgi:hypothetical protein
MLKAKIINAEKRKSRVTCSRCGLSYTGRNYCILYTNEKLAFFKMKLPDDKLRIYCHDCLYKVIGASMGVLKEVKLEMELVDHTVNLIFHK